MPDIQLHRWMTSFNIFILTLIWVQGSVIRNAQAALMWNLALDDTGSPKLPGTKNCGASGCRGIVQINSGETYQVNQECELRSKAISKSC